MTHAPGATIGIIGSGQLGRMIALAAALALFVVWERHRAKVRRSALLDLGLFQVRTFSWGNLAAAMVAGRLEMLAILALLTPGAWKR